MGSDLESFIQPTVSGEVSSGLFGCVRNNGHRFHEGVDLKPYLERRRGEPTDPVYAAMDGTVAHVAARNGQSGYGRYVVIEHNRDGVLVYTLYAHLASVDDRIERGVKVSAGDVLGIMGRSATGYTIPKARAHLHFEIGLRLGDSFQEWYDAQKFGSPNYHRDFNGMNLVGFDPLEFFGVQHKVGVSSLSAYIRSLPTAYVVQIRTTTTPSFVKWNPSLLTRSVQADAVHGWEIAFTAYGLPKEWTPLGQGDVASLKDGKPQVVDFDSRELGRYGCREMIRVQSGAATLSGEGINVLSLIFGRL